MADERLERMRRMLQEENEKKNGNRNSSGDKASYPYWNIPEKHTATVRFLPDRDDDNAWFWIERQTCKLPFDGVSGTNSSATPVLVTVPCVDMFGDTCPIIAASRPWWKTDEALARKYWKKRSFIAQGFVVSSPFEETDLPENPIRRLILGPSLLEKLKAGLVDTEMENTPIDYINGTDFKIKKTRKSDYNNYDTSEWSRRTRALTETERSAIDRYGLFNLKDFMGARPDANGIAMIKAMFEASVRGDPFDMDAFGAHYKPFGAFTNTNGAVPDGADDLTTPRETRETGATRSELPEEAAPSGEVNELISKLRERMPTRS
jgi:hypothetical protein